MGILEDNIKLLLECRRLRELLLRVRDLTIGEYGYIDPLYNEISKELSRLDMIIPKDKLPKLPRVISYD